MRADISASLSLTIDDYALPLPSSRAKLVFGPSRDGATSTCDLILDLSGGVPMFPAHELRPGYLRADPRDRAAVERAIADAGDLVGTFDKPRFIHFEESLCAHSRSAITGCTRCLDLCPTGAITPNGNAVAIDANICAGCGSCASVCPTGRGIVFAAERGCADAAVAHAAADLSQGGRQQRCRAVSRRRTWRRHHRRAGAVRRRPAGECASAARQRSNAARTGDDRGGVCLWRQRRRRG